jgi:hypothetical protein
MKVYYITGFQRKVDCSGFIIDWDDSKGIATVLTSAKLMRSPLDCDDYCVCMYALDFLVYVATSNISPSFG